MQGAGFDVSFTKDGNLLGTLESQYAANHGGSYTGLINTIINASVYNGVHGVIHDTANVYDKPTAYSGIYTLSASDFGSNGAVSWWGAQAYVNYLNSISYGGSHQWGLPSVTDTGSAGCNFAFSGTDCGYNVNTSTDPLAQLYYNELGKKGNYSTSGNVQNGYGIFGNNGAQVAGSAVGPFSNVQSYGYWSGTEYAPTPSFAWGFSTLNGFQGSGGYKGYQFYAWAVSPGQVNAVPVPGAVWLFGTGLVGLAGLKRRGHAG